MINAFNAKKVRRRILRQHNRLAAQIGDGLDGIAHHDAVAAVGPIHLLIDARHDARILAQGFHEQRHHVERAPADVDVAGRVGVAHRDGIVNQSQLDLEVLPAWSLPNLAGFEAVVGENDGSPAGPHVDGEAHRAVLQAACSWKCPAPAEASPREHICIPLRGDAGWCRELPSTVVICVFGWSLAVFDAGQGAEAPQAESNQTDHDREYCQEKRRPGITAGHKDSLL